MWMVFNLAFKIAHLAANIETKYVQYFETIENAKSLGWNQPPLVAHYKMRTF